MTWLERRQQFRMSSRETDKDITTFGEELQRLDVDVAGRPLDEGAQQDYRRALDAYDDAKLALGAARRADDLRSVTSVLDDGRYALASVRARLAGEPLPVRRAPCFFDPAHGPSTEDVDWAPPGGATRAVPACAADAQRIRAGAEPAVRTVLDGSRRVPYWQAGPAYSPWAQGYYGGWGGDLLTGVLIGSALGDWGELPDDGGGLSSGDGFIEDDTSFG